MNDDRKGAAEEDPVKIPDLEVREPGPTAHRGSHLHVERNPGFIGPFTTPAGEVYSEGSSSVGVFGAGARDTETEAKVFPQEVVEAVFPDVDKPRADAPILDDASIQAALEQPMHPRPPTHLHVERSPGFIGPFTTAAGEVYTEGSTSVDLYGAGPRDTETSAKVFPPEIVAAVDPGFAPPANAEPVLDDAAVEAALKIQAERPPLHPQSHLHVERAPGFVGPFTTPAGEVYSEGSATSGVYGAGAPEFDPTAKVVPPEIIDAIKIVEAKDEEKPS